MNERNLRALYLQFQRSGIALDHARAYVVDANATSCVFETALLVNPMTPCFAAWYVPRWLPPIRPPSEEQLTMAPLPCSRICCSSNFMQLHPLWTQYRAAPAGRFSSASICRGCSQNIPSSHPSRQMRWRRSSRVTTSPAFSKRTTRSRKGCSCSFTRFPFFQSSPESEFTWNGPNR
jgi:hypothetical protein